MVAWTDEDEPKPLLQIQKLPTTGIHTHYTRRTTDPLETRAWAFQERKLAHRYLSFTREEVQWSCSYGAQCECPSAWKRTHAGSNLRLELRRLDDWREAVMEYTGLGLTYESDKLPALSGLATRFQQLRGFKYFAGLWLNGILIEQLLWCRQNRRGDDLEYSLNWPTFSWASSNGGVLWYKEWSENWGTLTTTTNLEYYIEVLDTPCTLMGENKLGEIISAYLMVRGRAVRLKLKQPLSEETSPELLVDGEILDIELHFDGGDDKRFLRKASVPAGREPYPWRSMCWSTEGRNAPETIDVICLRVAASNLATRKDSKTDREYFLILIESAFKSGAFERIGLAVKEHRKRDRNGGYERFLELWNFAPAENITIM